MKYIATIILFTLCFIQIKSGKPETVIEFAKSKVGCGYVWGATGQILTESTLNRLYALHPDHVDKNICRKWLNMQVFDCAGLVKAAFETVGITLASGATSSWGSKVWERKGKLSEMPRDRVCVLFRGDGSHMEHTGIYILNNKYIHAAGSKSGVLEESMNGKWTHYAIPKGLYDSLPDPVVTEICSSYPCQARVGNASGTVNLRSGPSKSNGIVIRINVGELVTLNGYSNGWYQVSYNNKSGYMMAEFLNKA
jgi:hypothetical protein